MNEQYKKSLQDIYGTWYVPLWQRTSFYVAVTGIIIIFLVVVIFLLHKHFKNKKKPVPFWQVAINELSSLQYLDCTTQEKGAYVYISITKTLKQYLAQRYRFDLHAKTDEEIVAFIHKQSLSEDDKSYLEDVFSGSVLIKFAKEYAIKPQVERHINVGLSFIKKTKPQDKSLSL